MENSLDKLKEKVGNLSNNIDRVYLRMADLLTKLQSNTGSTSPIDINSDDKITELVNEIAYLKQINLDLEEKSKSIDEKNRMLKAALLMTVDHETKDVSESPDTLTSDQVIEVGKKDKKVALTVGPSGAKAPTQSQNQSEAEFKCPKCGASGAFILELADKLMCGDCRHEWAK